MAGGSKVAVYAAIVANVAVTSAKLVGFLMTGSGTMLAETIHSFADVGNQSLLALGMHQAAQPASEDHPEGRGREAFLWALVSAVGIFFLGCGVTVAHGVEVLLSHDTHELGDMRVAIGILVVSAIIEGGSFAVAVRELQHAAHERSQSLFEYVRTTDDPFGVAVLFEDGAAVLGVFAALASLWLAQVFHEPRIDAVGSIAIGLILGALAINLISRNRKYLVGRSVRVAEREQINAILSEDPVVERVALTRAIVEGSSTFRVSAEVDFDGHELARQYLAEHPVAELHASLTTPEELQVFLGDYSEDLMVAVGKEIDRLESKLAAALPGAEYIAIEPD